MKTLLSLESYGTFESYFSYLFILTLSSHPSMQNGGKGLPRIILASQGILVKCS